MRPTVLSLVLALPTYVAAWGASGHRAVGYIAMEFLSEKALSFVKDTLGPAYNESLGDAATWADDVRKQPAYAWSAVLHYVDAEDSPPSSCNVLQSRDCHGGMCILTGIANYTARVVDTSLPDIQRQEALKWLDHFLGDIGQPLHVEALEIGGNGIQVTCSGASINLHALWDSGIINKHLVTQHENSTSNWIQSLVSRIKNGDFTGEASSWTTCNDPTAISEDGQGLSIESDIASVVRREVPSDSPLPVLACPLVWASDSNGHNCDIVFEYEDGQDLCDSSYFDAAVPIIERQIAKQGFRLAAWLNALFDGLP